MSNNEIAHTDDTRTNLEVMPPARPVMATARHVLMEHAELAQIAYDFATKLVGTKMVPVRYRNQPEEATAAILYGAELGIGPISALQNIFEVHGSPGIYARTAQALLEAKGFQFKTAETTNVAAVVQGWKPGRDPNTHDPDEASKFTIEDAEQAGWSPRLHDGERGGKLINGSRYQTNENGKLIGNEKYLTQPRQMLWAKAMMEVCRHLSPATLLGIAYSVEELESEGASEFDTAQRDAVRAATGGPLGAPLTVEEILAAAPEQVVDQVFPDTTPGDLADPPPAQEPEPAKGKGKPKGQTSRVEAALAKARAKAAKAQPEPEPEQPKGKEPTWANMLGDDEPGEPESEPEKPAEPPVPEPEPDTPDPAAEQPAEQPASEAVLDSRPANREQLQELTQLIATAGFQPSDEGRAEWFAWLSQEVGREIRANNQLLSREIDQVGAALRFLTNPC